MNTIIPLCVMYVVCVLCIVCDVCVFYVCVLCVVCVVFVMCVFCVCVVFTVSFGVFFGFFGVFSFLLPFFLFISFYPWVWMDGLWDFGNTGLALNSSGHYGWDGQQQEIPLTTTNKIPPRNVDHVSQQYYDDYSMPSIFHSFHFRTLYTCTSSLCWTNLTFKYY